MKISLKKYAQALAISLKEEKSSKTVDSKISNLLKVFVKRKQTKQIKRFAEIFKDTWLHQQGQLELKVTLAHEASEAELKALSRMIGEALKKEVLLNVKIDPNVIGGMKLEFNDYVIDATLISNLQSLKTSLSS